MKKWIANIPFLLFFILFLSGCSAIGSKTASQSIIYGVTAAISLVLLIGCCFFVRKKKFWFILLFVSVFIVNSGYTFLSVSSCLDMALWANRIAYLGSVFLPLSMLMIIQDVTNTSYKKVLPRILLGLALLVFLVTASPGILDLYYKDVSFVVVDGVSMLVKVYGPLHPMYLFYLMGYFGAMIAVITRATIKKRFDSTAHAVFLIIAVFVNLGVWFIEQLSDFEFEMLSISYIISELFLLGIHLVMEENKRLREVVRRAEAYPLEDGLKTDAMLEKPLELDAIDPDHVEIFLNGLKGLTPTERAIYDAYVARVTTKEIMATLKIKESTLKYHNRNLYGKLGVSSRKELMEIHKYLKSVKSKLDEAN